MQTERLPFRQRIADPHDLIDVWTSLSYAMVMTDYWENDNVFLWNGRKCSFYSYGTRNYLTEIMTVHINDKIVKIVLTQEVFDGSGSIDFETVPCDDTQLELRLLV